MVESGLWWIRSAGDTRLRLARAEPDDEVAESDLVIVRDELGTRRPARIVGECLSRSTGVCTVGSIENRLVVDAGGQALSTLVDSDSVGESVSGHRWGAIGVPCGPETPLAASNEHSDVDLAFTSAGYREVQNHRIHRIVPGDVCRLDGGEVTVTAIDRRNNQVELARGPDGETITMALDEFIRKESRV